MYRFRDIALPLLFAILLVVGNSTAQGDPPVPNQHANNTTTERRNDLFPLDPNRPISPTKEKIAYAEVEKKLTVLLKDFNATTRKHANTRPGAEKAHTSFDLIHTIIENLPEGNEKEALIKKLIEVDGPYYADLERFSGIRTMPVDFLRAILAGQVAQGQDKMIFQVELERRLKDPVVQTYNKAGNVRIDNALNEVDKIRQLLRIKKDDEPLQIGKDEKYNYEQARAEVGKILANRLASMNQSERDVFVSTTAKALETSKETVFREYLLGAKRLIAEYHSKPAEEVEKAITADDFKNVFEKGFIKKYHERQSGGRSVMGNLEAGKYEEVAKNYQSTRAKENILDYVSQLDRRLKELEKDPKANVEEITALKNKMGHWGRVLNAANGEDVTLSLKTNHGEKIDPSKAEAGKDNPLHNVMAANLTTTVEKLPEMLRELNSLGGNTRGLERLTVPGEVSGRTLAETNAPLKTIAYHGEEGQKWRDITSETRQQQIQGPPEKEPAPDLTNGKTHGTGSDPAPDPDGKLKQTKPNETGKTTPQTTTTYTRDQVAQAMNQFGFNLFDQLKNGKTAEEMKEDPNTVMSPLSAFMALSMLYNGTDGDTKTEMQKVLQTHGISEDNLNNANALLMSALNGKDDVTLNVANSVWGNTNFKADADFLKDVAAAYEAKVDKFDTSQPTTEKAINDWVKLKTNGKISTMVDALNALDKLVLLNATYFNGKWTHKFPDAKPGKFNLEGNTTPADVMMMTQTGDFKHMNGDGYQAIELPYGPNKEPDKTVSMVVIVPEGNTTLAQVEQKLKSGGWGKITSSLDASNPKYGTVSMPKFEMRQKSDLVAALAAMGMPSAFQSGTANFSGLAADGDPEKLLAVDKALQKIYLNVNEVATEMAVSTGVTVVEISAPTIKFTTKADRPFMFAIRDRETGAILGLGSMRDPSRVKKKEE